MIFEKWLMPDTVLEDFTKLTPEAVRAMGAHIILSDIDNTVATYDDPTPPQRVLQWLEDMRLGGVRVAFV